MIINICIVLYRLPFARDAGQGDQIVACVFLMLHEFEGVHASHVRRL